MQQSPPEKDSPLLIVGLGNPGPKYAGTRHNVGFMAVEELVRRHGMAFSAKQGQAEVASGQIEGTRVIIAKPQTYMNESGRSVGALARFYKVPAERVLVVYDELDLPLGTIRIREKGSANGHNGIKIIIQHLGTQSFPRLRIGIDKPVVAGYNQIDWVLGRFTKDEQPIIAETLPRAAEAIEAILNIGMERAMNRYNTKEEQPKPPRKRGSIALPEPATDEPKEPPKQKLPPSPQPPHEETWAEKLRRIIQEESKGR